MAGWRRIFQNAYRYWSLRRREGWGRVVENWSSGANHFPRFREEAQRRLMWSRVRAVCERNQAAFTVASACSLGCYTIFKFQSSAPEFPRLVAAVEKIAGIQPPSPEGKDALPSPEKPSKAKDAPPKAKASVVTKTDKE